MQKLLADMMKNYLDSYDIWDTFDYIVPVPLHKKRLKERGYNQSELIAKEVAEYLKNTYAYRFAYPHKKQLKTKFTCTNGTCYNVQSAFKCTEKCDGKKILLLTIFTPQETPLSLVQENWRITVLSKYVL